MGMPSVNQLAYLESQLYPYGYGAGYNANCPSFANGYRGGMSYGSMNNSMMSVFPAYQQYYNSKNAQMGNSGNSSVFNSSQQSVSQPLSQSQSQVNFQGQPQVGFGASQNDLDILGDNYVKEMRPSETLKGAVISGASFGLINNMRWFAHPYNSIKAAFSTSDILKDMGKAGTQLNEFWKNPETNQLARDFYYRVHKLEGMNPALSRLPFAKQQLSDTTYKSLLDEAKRLVKDAKPGDAAWKESVATLNEKIRIANDAQTGWLNKGWHKVKGWFGGNKEIRSVEKRLKDTDAIKSAVQKTLADQTTKLTLSKALKHSCTFKTIGSWALFDLVFGIGDLYTAYKAQKSGDKKYDNAFWKQLGQTSVRALGNGVGWAVGEGIGTWAGATIGTAIMPGIGTAIGAVAGMIGGSIGMWLTGKLTQGMVGDNVAAKIEADNLKKTPEGHVQLLQHTIQQIQDGKKVDQRTMQAAQNVMNVYA